jgi:hypothetical protein
MEKNTKKPPQKNPQSQGNTDDINFQSFLIPKHFRNQSVYRNSSLFRLSLLGIVLIIAATAYSGALLYTATKTSKTIQLTQNIETEEATRLQSQSNSYRPIREKFRELEALRRQLRVPLSPVLDAIEKTIPQEVSINRFSSTCTPTASTSTLRRKMQVQIEVFLPLGVSGDSPIIGAWPETLAETLQRTGLLVSDANWGPEREYKRIAEDTKKKRANQVVGSTKDLNLTIEISPE